MNMMETPDEKEIMNNPYIMSFTQALGKHSFIDANQKFYKLAPPPIYFTDEFLKKMYEELPVNREDVLLGFEYPENGGLVCTD